MARKSVSKSVSTENATGSSLGGDEDRGSLLAGLRGHEATVRVLTEAIARGRLASTLLFIGPSGVGKKRAARGLAQILLCERRTQGEPIACGECGPCVRVARGQSESVLIIEPQGTGIKIEQSQEILQFLHLRQLGRGRVVIINDAHLLNPQAGNALLKALEEPPANTHFVLVTSQPGALLSTIRSRSQSIRFQALQDTIVAELTGAPEWIVRAAQGSLEAAHRLSEGSDEWSVLRRTALSVLDALVEGRPSESLDTLRDLIKERAAALFVAQVWGRALRDFAYSSAGGGMSPERLHLPDQLALIARGARLPVGWLEQLADLVLQLEQDIHRNVDKNLAFENVCMAMAGAYAGREPRPMIS